VAKLTLNAITGGEERGEAEKESYRSPEKFEDLPSKTSK
jgi:hypothetical protein